MRRAKWTPSQESTVCSNHFEAECLGALAREPEVAEPVEKCKPPKPRSSEDKTRLPSTSTTPSLIMADPPDEIPPFDKYIWEQVGILIGTSISAVIWTLFMAVILTIPISMIAIGAVYLDDCPAERLIPIYMITMGAAHIVKTLINLKWRTQRSRLPQEEQADFKRNKVESGISHLIAVFCFAYFIAGNVWIYRIYKPNTTVRSAADYCHPTLYYFAFWVTTAWYIMAVLYCFYKCCTGCLAYCGVTASGDGVTATDDGVTATDDGVIATATPAQTLKIETSP
ncbi:transmembrane protein 272-like [Strongylocentrotus purpuratus]|uniref:Uncharacterized protein n=1 Tax=Strongylocentrotus purpuratus TaxID=7668 RepID=A0A7M7PF95_STRPU|nr:transmembrane protein 272-like [Strongylocentrotus purpuratus]